MHQPTVNAQKTQRDEATRKRLEGIRLKTVKRVLAGESVTSLARSEGIHRSCIYKWLKAYRQYGVTGLRAKPISGRPPKNTTIGNERAFNPPPLQSAANLPKIISPELQETTGNLKACESNLDSWVLLLNQSLLNKKYPLSDFLAKLGNSLGGPAVIASNLYQPLSMVRAVDEEGNLDELISINRNTAKQWYANPFLDALCQPGDLRTLSELIADDKWEENGFCRILSSVNITQALGLCFAGPNALRCGLFIYRFGSDRDFNKATKQFLYRLRPHLETAMALAVNHWREHFTVKALEEATDHLDIAALALDGHGQLIKASVTAREWLSKETYFKLIDGQLTFRQAKDQETFIRAVNQAIAWRQEPFGNKPVEAMRFHCRRKASSGTSGEALLGILVQAITPPSMDIPHSIAVSPHVMVYISEQGKTRISPKQHLIAHLFNLSTREAYLTTLLAEGRSINEAARVMNITQATARTYRQHIYEKVGVNRQQDLVQQVMKSVAVLV